MIEFKNESFVRPVDCGGCETSQEGVAYSYFWMCKSCGNNTGTISKLEWEKIKQLAGA